MPTIQTTKETAPRPINWMRPTPSDLARWIKERLTNGANPTLTAHAGRDRLTQRGFAYDDVLRILRSGFPYKAERGDGANEWKVNLSLGMSSGRDAAAVCLVSPHTTNIAVLTVMWVD